MGTLLNHVNKPRYVCRTRSVVFLRSERQTVPDFSWVMWWLHYIINLWLQHISSEHYICKRISKLNFTIHMNLRITWHFHGQMPISQIKNVNMPAQLKFQHHRKMSIAMIQRNVSDIGATMNIVQTTDNIYSLFPTINPESIGRPLYTRLYRV